jgi:hypothetical protein
MDFPKIEPVVLSKPEELPSTRDILIHRIEVERRNETVRIIIDFTGFAPGSLVLPALSIPSGGADLVLPSSVTIPIASILTGDALVLSPLIPPLTVPGTALLIYGTTGTIFLMLLLGLGLRFWGRDRFKDWRNRFQRRRLLRFMEKVLQSLEKDISEHKSGGLKTEEILTRLSLEFRTFLSVFTGMHCHAMTASEFMHISSLITAELESAGQPVLSGAFLCDIFRRCDTLRFSGTRIASEELLSILNGIQRFINALNQAEKNSIRGAA